MVTMTYDENQGETPTLPGSKGLTVSAKPTRAERREAVRAQRAAIALQEQARADAPVAHLENQSAPGVPQVTGEQAVQEARQLRSQGIQDLKGLGILPRGRPSEFTEEEGDAICEWVGEGKSLRSYCRHHGRAMGTVYKWMRESAVFLARYTRAHEDRADTLTDELLDIADDAAKDPTIEGVAAAKLRVEARKWIAAKLRPNKWGDKQVVEHTGGVSIRIGIKPKPQQQAVEDAVIVGEALPAP